jgi:hypothetical protein
VSPFPSGGKAAREERATGKQRIRHATGQHLTTKLCGLSPKHVIAVGRQTSKKRDEVSTFESSRD